VRTKVDHRERFHEPILIGIQRRPAYAAAAIILLQVMLATLCFFAADTLVELVGRWILLGISLLFHEEFGNWTRRATRVIV